MMKRMLKLVLVLMFAVVLCGCGPKPSAVSGIAVLNGEETPFVLPVWQVNSGIQNQLVFKPGEVPTVTWVNTSCMYDIFLLESENMYVLNVQCDVKE
ncbi:hypothetical protein IT417_02730 [bacterium]|nr:hypothetical protein [bacterium]